MKSRLTIIFLVTALVLFSAGWFWQLANAVVETKTLSFFVGQSVGPASSASWPFTFYIGDDVTSVKSAFFEISGISPDTANLTITADLDGGCSANKILNNSGRKNEFKMLYDVSSCVGVSGKGEYAKTLNVSFSGGQQVDAVSADFSITYQYNTPSSLGNVAMKTISFSAIEGTTPSAVSAGQNNDFSFNFYIGDNSPVIKSAFFEISGVSTAASSDISLSLIGGSGACNLTRALDTTGQSNQFNILYNVTSCINADNKGDYSRTLRVNSGSSTVYIYSARLVLTYQFIPPASGGYPVAGTVFSPVFDTGVVNGAAFNWILVKGATPGSTKVRLQFASSNSPAGPFSYLGPDCSSGTYYYDSALSLAEESKEIGCFADHNNKRYFRYKAVLLSDIPNHVLTPQIDEIIINWSP